MVVQMPPPTLIASETKLLQTTLRNMQDFQILFLWLAGVGGIAFISMIYMMTIFKSILWGLLFLIFYMSASFYIARRIREHVKQTREMNEGLLKMMESIKNSSQVKSDYLASMSHEIRTPLNALIGFSELLTASNLNKEQLRQVRTINESAKLLLEIANDILDVAKIESGAIQLESLEFDLEYLIHSLFDMTRPRLEGKTVEFKLKIEDARLRRLKGDPTRLRQILLNLIGNATKFTDDGVIGVEVRSVPSKELSKQSLIEFTVWDTGIGIPKERHEVIFESFSQANNDTSRKYGGTGLGLAIVKKLVTLLGGDVKLYSKEGKGSRFVCTVKMEMATPAGFYTPPQEIRPVPSALLKGCQIAIIDSNDSDQKILSEFVESNEMRVVGIFSTYDQAIRQLELQTTPIQIIFIEPALLTSDQIQSIRKMNPRSLTIAVTNDVVPGAAKRIQALGFDAYLGKPFEYKDMQGILQSVLGDDRKEKLSILTRHTYPEITRSIATREKAVVRKILIAEDNPINQELIRAFMQKLQIEYDLVSNGKEAVEAIAQHSYGLILMDLQMPEMGGIEATSQIRSRNIQAPVIAMTAAVLQEDRERCKEVGMDDFLSKPINFEELKSKIHQWMP